jgi:hypothetical protein
MPRWDYRILQTWWEETNRSTEYVTTVDYRHVWQPGDTVEEWAAGMTANLGADEWELVAITTTSVTLPVVLSPQGNDSYQSFPVHKAFFKRPAT